MLARIQKILSDAGVASRRQAEKWITEGRVTCNGRICVLGQSADPDTDCICVDGRQILNKQEYVYLMLHKPRDYVTTLSDEKGRKNVAQLVKDCGKRVYPVGRLDMDSEGLLLFTNDGEFANYMMHPRHEMEKTYLVLVTGFAPEKVEALKEPIVLDGRPIVPPVVKLLSVEGNSARILVTIHEGRNRQVRRMCGQAGLPVQRLARVQEGNLKLGDLPAGKWRYLTEAEVDMLKGEKSDE
jgi:23S rRNA pseudouridine2605 synthase